MVEDGREGSFSGQSYIWSLEVLQYPSDNLVSLAYLSLSVLVLPLSPSLPHNVPTYKGWLLFTHTWITKLFFSQCIVFTCNPKKALSSFNYIKRAFKREEQHLYIWILLNYRTHTHTHAATHRNILMSIISLYSDLSSISKKKWSVYNCLQYFFLSQIQLVCAEKQHVSHLSKQISSLRYEFTRLTHIEGIEWKRRKDESWKKQAVLRCLYGQKRLSTFAVIFQDLIKPCQVRTETPAHMTLFNWAPHAVWVIVTNAGKQQYG